MKKIFALLFLTIISCQITRDNQLERKVSLLLRIARGYLSKCVYSQALKEVQSALTLDPQSFVVNDALGVVYYSLKEYEKSKLYFTKSISIEPKYTQAKINIAQVLIEQKKWNAGLKFLQQAENDLTYLNPGLVQFLIGKVFVMKKDFPQATKHLKTSQQINQNNCPTFIELGKISFYSKKYQQALKYFIATNSCLQKIKKIQCMPQITEQYYYKALSEIALRKKREAIISLKKYLFKSNSRSQYRKASNKLLKRLR